MYGPSTAVPRSRLSAVSAIATYYLWWLFNKLLRRLDTNIAINDVSERVIVVRGVVSNSAGEVTIHTIPGREEYSSLGDMSHPAIADAQISKLSVQSSTVDLLVETHGLNPGFIKIDVEGCEHLVLAGALRTLASFRPVVLSELSDSLLRKNGSSGASVVDTFIRAGYAVFDPLDPRSRSVGSKPLGDLLAVPSELGMTAQALEDLIDCVAFSKP